MTIEQYIDNINNRYKLGNATEHTFRGDLQQLIESLVPTIRATNEPKRQSCGAPDYILTKKEIPVGFIEAKDIGDKDLDGAKKTGNKEQFDRYKASLSNLIFTDYINFHLYREGEFVTKIAIAEVTEKGIKPISENFESFEKLIIDFCTHIGQTIKSSKKLAEMMAGKARLLSEVIEKALTSDEENSEDSTLKDQMNAFKEVLIHDITPKGFADVYAQTIAYGMFAARYHDPTLPTFNRQEAYELIPKSNPFLKKLFGYIAGLDVDDRIKWIVDDLVNIFLACNVEEMLKGYGKSTKKEDPIVHFYEDFLSEYDPKLRKARGVWYTPAPVVNFIVRAVDDILKTEFGLPLGLADTSTTKIKLLTQTKDKRTKQGYKEEEREVHRVQILDPAIGTGTFLAEVIKLIYKKFEGQKGIWSDYVETHLLPRLNGFELLMASYAMAHLKLDLLLQETGFKPTKDQRFRIYLTNSLEEYYPDTGTLFANWLSTEANEANYIKRDTPVMCIIGNPPYNGESANKGEWIDNLINIYKYDHNGIRISDTKWLNNDYVKFLRYGQYYIEKNGSGVLAFITDNSFLDSISFCGMRWNLLKTYDKIFVLNLHGNSKKKESTPDGCTDQNVFDIQQGVSINILVKSGKKKSNELSTVFYQDLFGKRDFKYDFLWNNSLNSTSFIGLKPSQPNFFLVPKDFSLQNKYDTFIQIDDLLNLNGVGICSKRDETAIRLNIKELLNVLNDFKELSATEIRSQYKTEVKESRDKKLVYAKDNIAKYGLKEEYFREINYRPFDNRWTYFTEQSRGFLAYPVYAIMKHFADRNYGLVVSKKSRQLSLGYMFITNTITDLHILDSAADSTYLFPLYLYYETIDPQTHKQITERTPNIKPEIVKQIAEKLGLTFTNEKETTENTFAPIDILDYIYAVLHSPTYRKRYKEFLKIDFPRVPYPKDKDIFWQLVKLGGEIRQIHLLESPKVENYITRYLEAGSNVVEKIDFQMYDYEHSIPNENGDIEYPDYLGAVYINDNQYFADVPYSAWNFYIGGYQPAQKWLKDRKGRKLEYEDILHYQKIIVALTETEKLMNEIDKIEIE